MDTTSVIDPAGGWAPAVQLPDVELVFDDGVPMETPWHRFQMNLLIDLTQQQFQSLGRRDFYTGGNMFLYFSTEQVRNRDYRGPDYFTVLHVDPEREREGWVVWEEHGRYPDLIVELLSESTRQEDLGKKKELYERTFRTPEYFCWGRDGELLGWRLTEGFYRPIAPDERGWMWSETLHAHMGHWQGRFMELEALWLRLYDTGGRLVPLWAEAAGAKAEAAVAKAEAAEAKAEAAEAKAEAAEAKAEAAEAKARQEAEQRQAAEASLRQLQAELRRLQGGGES